MEDAAAQAASKRIQATWSPSTIDLESRSVDLIFSKGADAVRRNAFGERFVERLRVDAASVNLDRLNRGAPLLNSHTANDVRGQLGVVEKAWIANGEAHARVRFSARAADIFQDVADGIIRNVSVGYTTDEVRELDERIGGLPVVEATRWSPHELSLVTIAADSGAQIRSADEAVTKPKDSKIMEIEETQTPALDPSAVAVERRRVAAINDAADKLHVARTFADGLIERGVNLADAREAIIAKAEKDHVHIGSHYLPGDGKREGNFARAASAALLHRERIEDTTDRDALELTSRSMIELARQCAQMDGIGLSDTSSAAEIATRALTSSTLGNVIALTAGRALGIGYDAEPRVFAEIFREVSAKNFRNIQRVKLSDVPALPLVAEGDPITEATLSDSQESYKLVTFGSIVSFTRQLLVNDDVDAVARVPQTLGGAAAARENDVSWGVLNANANMADTNPIFATATTNLVAGGTLTAGVLETARQAMLTRVTENGVAMGLQPVWLVVGPDLLASAEKLVRPPTDYSTSTLANTLSTALANQLQLRVEPRIPTGRFYLFSGYTRFDTCEYAYLQGQRGVSLEREVEFSTGALRLKATLDFGFGVIDRRGLYRVDPAG